MYRLDDFHSRTVTINTPIIEDILDIRVSLDIAFIVTHIRSRQNGNLEIRVAINEAQKIRHEMVGKAIYPRLKTDRHFYEYERLGDSDDRRTPDYIDDANRVILEIGGSTPKNERNYYNDKTQTYRNAIDNRNAIRSAEGRPVYDYLVFVTSGGSATMNFDFVDDRILPRVKEYFQKYDIVVAELDKMGINAFVTEDNDEEEMNKILSSLNNANLFCKNLIPERDERRDPLIISKEFIDACYQDRDDEFYSKILLDLMDMSRKTQPTELESKDPLRVLSDLRETFRTEIKKKAPLGFRTKMKAISNFCMIYPKTTKRNQDILKDTHLFEKKDFPVATGIVGNDKMAILIRSILASVDQKNFPVTDLSEMRKKAESVKWLMTDEEYEDVLMKSMAKYGGTMDTLWADRKFKEYLNRSIRLYKPEFENKALPRLNQIDAKLIKKDLKLRLFLSDHGAYSLSEDEKKLKPTFEKNDRNKTFSLDIPTTDIMRCHLTMDCSKTGKHAKTDFYRDCKSLEDLAESFASMDDDGMIVERKRSISEETLDLILKTDICQSLSLISMITFYTLLSYKKLPLSSTSWVCSKLPWFNLWVFHRIRLGNNTKEIVLFYVWETSDFGIIEGPWHKVRKHGKYSSSSIFSLDSARIMNHIGIDLRFANHLFSIYEDKDLIIPGALKNNSLTSSEQSRKRDSNRIAAFTLMGMLEGKKNTSADLLLNRYLIMGSLSSVKNQVAKIKDKYSFMLKSRFSAYVYNCVLDTIERHLLHPPEIEGNDFSKENFERKEVRKIKNLFCYVSQDYQDDISHFINWNLYQGFYLAASAGSEVHGNKQIVQKMLKIEVVYLKEIFEKRANGETFRYMNPFEKEIPLPESLGAYESSFLVKMLMRRTAQDTMKKRSGPGYQETIWLDFVSEVNKKQLLNIATFKASATRGDTYEPIEREIGRAHV